jgi:hypothetical protein
VSDRRTGVISGHLFLRLEPPCGMRNIPYDRMKISLYLCDPPPVTNRSLHTYVSGHRHCSVIDFFPSVPLCSRTTLDLLSRVLIKM